MYFYNMHEGGHSPPKGYKPASRALRAGSASPCVPATPKKVNNSAHEPFLDTDIPTYMEGTCSNGGQRSCQGPSAPAGTPKVDPSMVSMSS